MTSSPHGPYVQGYTRATMVTTKGCEPARGSQSQKSGLSTDRSLQLDSLKSESLVIADQHGSGEYVPGPCTHPRHTMGVDCSRSGRANPQGRQAPKEWSVTGVKS